MSYGMFIEIQWAMTKSGSGHEKPYPVSYRVYHSMAYDTRQNACIEIPKISCKSLQKSIEAMVMKEKRLLQITLSLFDENCE